MRTWTKHDPVKNYFPLPNEIYQLGLSHGAIAVYGYLLRIEDRRTYQCHPSYSFYKHWTHPVIYSDQISDLYRIQNFSRNIFVVLVHPTPHLSEIKAFPQVMRSLSSSSLGTNTITSHPAATSGSSNLR